MLNDELPSPDREPRPHPNAGFQKFATVVVIGIGTLVPSVLFLAPTIEEGRAEARYMMDRVQCRKLTLALQAQPSQARLVGRKTVRQLDDQSIVVELVEDDHWGTPYQAVLKGPEHRVIRVFGCGIDQASESAGLDFDDMSLDLKETYLDRVRHQRRRQWLITLAVWLVSWSIFSGFRLSHDRRRVSLETRPST